MHHDVGLIHTAVVRVFLCFNLPNFGRLVAQGRQP
jgi:hypothetical protein